MGNHFLRKDEERRPRNQPAARSTARNCCLAAPISERPHFRSAQALLELEVGIVMRAVLQQDIQPAAGV